MGQQQALSTIKPEKIGVPVLIVRKRSWIRDERGAKDGDELLRATQHHAPIVGLSRSAPLTCDESCPNVLGRAEAGVGLGESAMESRSIEGPWPAVPIGGSCDHRRRRP